MNGITLRADYGPYLVTAISPTQHFYTDTGLSSAVTLPAVITATTTWYCAPAYSGFYTFTCTQLDGSDISPGVPQWVGTTADSTLNPRPSLGQLAADVAVDGGLPSGSYIFTTSPRNSTTAGGSLNLLRLYPWRVRSAASLTRIGAEITSAGTSGSVLRLGIYASDGLGAVGQLVVDGGTIDGTSATVQEATISVSLTPGVYWIGGVSQVAAPTIRCINDAIIDTPIPYQTTIPSASAAYFGVQSASVTGALPATLTSPAPLTVAPPRVFVKTA